MITFNEGTTPSEGININPVSIVANTPASVLVPNKTPVSNAASERRDILITSGKIAPNKMLGMKTVNNTIGNIFNTSNILNCQ